MSSPSRDPRVPPNDRCVLRPLLERQAARQPDKGYVWFESGKEWTYAQMRNEAVRAANALRSLGVKRGDKVICWLPSGPDILRLWFGLNYLGAVYVPINLAYRGQLLEHVIDNSDATLMLAHVDLVPRLEGIRQAKLRRVVVLGGKAAPVPGIELLAPETLDSTDETPPPLDAPIEPWDLQSIIYTSGTTGPSKGVM